MTVGGLLEVFRIVFNIQYWAIFARFSNDFLNVYFRNVYIHQVLLATFSIRYSNSSADLV